MANCDSKSALNNHANQLNPTNPVHRELGGLGITKCGTTNRSSSKHE